MSFKSCRPVILLLAFIFLITGNLTSQTCTEGAIVYDSDVYEDIYVNADAPVCIAKDVTIYGNVYMNGGTLYNNGVINSLILNNGAGTIENYGTIYNSETVIVAANDLAINAYPSAYMEFTNGIDIESSFILAFKQYNGGHVNFTQDISFTKGTFVITNGAPITIESSPVTTTGYFNADNLSIAYANLSITNSSTGDINFAGSLNLSDGGEKTIINEGVINIYNSLNIAGDADSKAVTIQNFHQFFINEDLTSSLYNGSFTFTNQEPTEAGGDGAVAVAGSILLSSEASSFINNGSVSVDLDLIIDDGILTNNGSIDVLNLFGVKGLVNAGQRSIIVTTDYDNAGTIAGPLMLDDDSDGKYFPKIHMRGSSNNSGNLSGYLLFFDETLQLSPGNVNYGFDVVSNTSGIGEQVKYITTSKEGLEQETNCAFLSQLLSLSINSDPTPRCPGGGISMSAYTNMQFIGTSGPYTTPVAATYVWQPGSLTGSSVLVTPLATTIYTLTATYQGCSVTQTVQVNIINLNLPTISYANTTVIFPSVTTFPVIRSSGTGGNYSITKLGGGTCSGVSINSAGLIIVTNTICFGTYVVHLCMNVPGPCEYVCVTTIVEITNGSCPFTAAQPTLALCPDDKTQLAITGAPLSYIWTPVTGLDCSTCKTVMLTMDDSGARTYTITSKNGNGIVCGTATISVLAKTDCQKDDIIGCCFGNYGAAVQVENNTFLNIYCNLINELGSTSPVVTPSTLEKGEFRNQAGGTVRVLLDWIHNAKNTLYIPAVVTPTTSPLTYIAHAGTTTVFGDDQKIRGNSNTEFNELRLEGSGTKSIFINEYGYSILNLNDLVLNLQNFTYAIKNKNTEIKRTTGYARSNKNGYLSWQMNPTSADYIFPMGSPASMYAQFRYRPIIIKNNAVTADEISVNFMNDAPSFNDAAFVSNGSGNLNLINLQAPNVLQINHKFYHKIKTTIPSTASSSLNIKYYYMPADGTFQSIAEWELDPAQINSWWGSTPGPSAITNTSSAPNTYGMLSAISNGTYNFNYKPFTLSRAGFYLNTNSFGDAGNGSNAIGTSISLSATPLPGGTTAPAGGGLGNSFGTGPTSGNSGSGGNTIFAPNPVTGKYEMTITPANSCAIPGRIKFVINEDGNIDPGSVEYGDSTTSSNYLGNLSQGLYTLDALNSGITFSATPRDLLRNCVNLISVRTTTNNDFVLDQSLSPAEKIEITLPASYTFGNFNMEKYNTTGLAFTTFIAPLLPGTNQYSIPGTPQVGVYKFYFTVTSTVNPAVSETIRGQIIIK